MSDVRLNASRIVAAGVPDLDHATWTNGIRIGSELVLSGMTAHPATVTANQPLSTYEQALIVLNKIKSLVEAEGGSIANIARLTVYVTDIADKDQITRARRVFFAGLGAYPTSTLVAVSGLVFPELTVEIEASARLDFDLRQIRPPQ
ncbi:enamine deaminase RidA (YjgF/YER057c/UK114 family) [Paraburkholderia caballeronis]|uniref:RidA family protein n=1 Tax=Paraburkholderia caballeronis TaxID=416943 RepID=UPI001064F56B|nr:RidA family protein [Paraburkholderia caballeronis]TDV34292.1 enamine deaminase RidA (YjgF/YER057c/UK114 family) [Paraburkholderia caballeronis]